MIALNGMGSQIAKELLALLPVGEQAVGYKLPGDHPLEADRFVFCQGFLAGRTASDHDADTAAETFSANFLDVAAACDRIFAANFKARVVVLGSESGFAGSYDAAYAGAKAALHLYVETKKLKPLQQLVAVAPWVVADAGMTKRRTDQCELAQREMAHPKGRWITSRAIAKLIKYLLYEDDGYLTGTVIRVNGGPA